MAGTMLERVEELGIYIIFDFPSISYNMHIIITIYIIIIILRSSWPQYEENNPYALSHGPMNIIHRIPVQ